MTERNVKRTCHFVILVYRVDDVAKMTLRRVHRSFYALRACVYPSPRI
jgi:hypothetical protein